jgi:hypothetical protein
MSSLFTFTTADRFHHYCNIDSHFLQLISSLSADGQPLAGEKRMGRNTASGLYGMNIFFSAFSFSFVWPLYLILVQFVYIYDRGQISLLL